MTKKVLLLISLTLLLLTACTAQPSDENLDVVSGEEIFIEVYRAPT
jgi:hypothetical protein